MVGARSSLQAPAKPLLKALQSFVQGTRSGETGWWRREVAWWYSAIILSQIDRAGDELMRCWGASRPHANPARSHARTRLARYESISKGLIRGRLNLRRVWGSSSSTTGPCIAASVRGEDSSHECVGGDLHIRLGPGAYFLCWLLS
jgi:hypothetical protein